MIARHLIKFYINEEHIFNFDLPTIPNEGEIVIWENVYYGVSFRLFEFINDDHGFRSEIHVYLEEVSKF